ncbi:LPD23 domain-containing protein [Campylobacter concisus]|uniref:ADP-ribosyltransferase-containing protein n=1 Tax=Campylobacter concisus TaxID=199 RepID=UPI0015E173B1|nr:LPD23 domain-containing protein [Campylobacter concisus]
MAWIKIPENKTEMQIGGNWVKIPSGMKEVEIPDNLLGTQPTANSAPTYAPPAPDMSKAVDATPKEKTWYDKVGEFADKISPINVIKGVGKELGGMLEYSHYDGATGKELEAKKATEALARAKHASDDRNIISQLTGDESKDQAVKERTENLLYNWAKKNNYDDVREANGKYYLQKGDNFIPVDEPGIGDSVSTYLNEMGVPMGAITLASNLLPNKKLSAAQKAITTALGTAGASGIGAAMDVFTDKRILGDDSITTDDYLKHALRGASDDALVSAPLAAMASPAVKEALKKGAKTASDLSLVKPLARYVINDNIGGAEKAIMDKLGGEANAAAAQNLSKNALGDDLYKTLLNDDQAYTLPKVGNEKIQKGINYVNDNILAPAQKITRDMIKGEGTREREMDLFLTALGNDAKGADIIADAVARDPKSFSKIYKMSSDLNADAKNAFLNMIEKKKTADILSGYEKRTKDNFGEVINALDDAFVGKEASANLLQAKHELGTQALRLPAGYRDSTLELLGNTKGFKGLNEVRNVLSADMARLTAPDAITAGTKKTLGKMIEAVDNAIDNVAEQAFSNPALSQKAKDVLKQARSEYALFKELQNSKIYHDVMGELKSSGDITNSLLKALNAENGLDLKALTARLSSSEQEALETNLIRGVIEKFTKDGITDFSKVSDTLKNAPFESKRAVEIMGELNKKAPILNNTSSLLEKLTAINPKAKELQQGIGHSVTGALMTMKRNLAIERLKSLLPVLGNDASLKNHIRNAINNAGDLKSVINNLEKIEIKDAPENSTKLLKAFKNEVKALREEAQTGEIKGDNFITKESPAPKSDLNVKISVDDWVRELSEINNNELSANLFILQNKHPELFKKPSDVYRLLKEIKNNPTHFFKNNRPDIALIAKVLEDGSVGKLGIVKGSGLVGHLSKSTNKNEMDRLRKVNEKELKVGTPYPTLQRADVNQVGPTAGAKSTFSSSDESIIPQKDKNTKTINASPHIASGLLGGTANGADENGNVSPEEFAKGFIYALFGSKFSASAVKRISPELYNSILGLGKKMPQMAKDNPKLLTKIYGSAKSNSINSFAGEKAFNASANKLSKAKAMLEKGEDEVKIWQSTGWYKDKDGAWKFEIDDSPAKIKNQNADKLGDLLEHKELFKAYPELKDINVVKIKDELYNKNLKDWHKESSPLTKNIDGTPKIFYHGTKKSNISEFDQKFDKSKWGFFFTTDKGLSEEYSKGRYGLKEPNSGVMEVYINAKKPFDLREEITNDTVKKYQALLGNLAKRDDIKNGVGKSLYEYIKNTNLKQYDTKARAFKDKLQNAGYDSIILDDNVIVAFNPNQIKHVKNNGNFNKENDIYASGNKGYYDPAKKEIGLREIADKSTLMHEIQHAIQDIEGFAKGSNTNDKKYALSHGEAEARNVQNRLNLNKKDRVYPHETFDVNPNDTFVSREDGVNFSKKPPELKEKRGIYNVTYNGKNSTQIKQDLDNINDAIKYERGNIGKGAKHISIRHLDDENKAGFVTKEELLNLGENVRNFIKEHKEPFVNKKNARIYEWEDDKGVRFKLVVSNKNGEGRGLPLGKSQDVSSITNDLRPATKKGLSPSGSLDNIITFYSDRNLKEPMKFENPKLKLLDAIDASSDKVGLVKKVLLNKDISDGVKAKAVNRLTKNKISQGAKTSYISTKNSKNN